MGLDWVGLQLDLVGLQLRTIHLAKRRILGWQVLNPFREKCFTTVLKHGMCSINENHGFILHVHSGFLPFSI